MSDCRVCETPDSEKPMVFRGEPYCSDDHRKVIIGELKPTGDEWVYMDQDLYMELQALWERKARDIAQ